jgi:uncharacterized cupin superfamily protein
MSDRSVGAGVWHVDAVDDWVPDEETGGLIRTIRTSESVIVGLWKPNGVAGVRIEYQLDSDETLVVLNGTGEVRVNGGEPIALSPGVVVSLPRGCRLSWLVDQDFRELWIYS